MESITMIKATDLRLGNLVLFDGEPKVIASINSAIVGLEGIRGPIGIHQIEGVVLTPDWLQRIGFEYEEFVFKMRGWKHKPSHFWTPMIDRGLDTMVNGYGYLQLNSENIDGPFFLVASDEEGYQSTAIGEEIKHIHQLQNLYSAITGKDFIIIL